MNALTSRVSAPLAVCLLGAAIAGVMLFRSPSSTTDSTPYAPPEAEGVEAAAIDIVDFAFSGATDATPGQPIAITNSDTAPHTLTSVDGAFDTGLIDGGGAAGFAAPTQPGTYAYFCALHPSMTGTLVVG